MEQESRDRQNPGFGPWLSGQIRLRGMNQSEFAERMGLSNSTVSRWTNGRIPEAKLLERIADVLVIDYDEVATRAGYRPRDVGPVDPASPEATLIHLIRQVKWDDPRRLESMERDLRWFIELDQREKI